MMTSPTHPPLSPKDSPKMFDSLETRRADGSIVSLQTRIDLTNHGKEENFESNGGTQRPATVPKRRKSTRPTMKMKSPYKSPPARAAKSSAKQKSSAKKLTPVRKAAEKLSAKEEKMKARARAREWAQRELDKKKLTAVDPALVIVVDDEDETELKTNVTHADSNTKKAPGSNSPTYTKCEYLHTKKSTANKKIDEAFDVDVFYDALESLPEKENVAVEDVSDEEDDEMIDLHSFQRNRVPSTGWMEPSEPSTLEPEGLSFSTFVSKQDP